MTNFLIIGTDNQPEKLLGLGIFLKTLAKNYPTCFIQWKVTILAPTHINPLKIKHLTPECQVVSIKSKNFQNPYLCKMVLTSFVSEYCSDNDHILYLDYDHVCFMPFNLPEILEGTIYLSSETHPLYLNHLINKIDISKLSIHFNTSLIYSYAKDFIKATSAWENQALHLENWVNGRNLEEIAFTFSAYEQGLTLLPVSTDFQANWENPASGSLFHYGGVNANAIYCKSLIVQDCQQTNLIFQKATVDSLLNMIQEIK